MKLPKFSVWALRLALLYLALGFTLGGLILFHKGIPLTPALWSLLPLHIEALVFGWLVHLIGGVAFWILPRFAKPPKRGNEKLAWTALLLLNGGIWLSGLGPYFVVKEILILAGRVSELLAAVAFALHAWPRIKPPGP
jgi:hypothetical protein